MVRPCEPGVVSHRLRRALVATGLSVLVVALLSGCVRFTSTLEVTPENTVSGEYIVAVVDGTGAAVGLSDRDLAEDLWADTGLGAALADAAITDYAVDGYTGIRVTFADQPLTAFAPTDEHWGITREGDEFVVTGTISGGGSLPSGAEESDGPDPDVTVSITFPGPVSSANGSVSGRTVSWVVTESETELQARAAAEPVPDRARTLAFLVTGILAVAAVAYWLAGVVGRSRRSGSGPA